MSLSGRGRTRPAAGASAAGASRHVTSPKRYGGEGPVSTVSLAIAHFAVGLLGTALLLAAVAPRLLRSPTLLSLGGLWGMIPDAYWIAPVGADLFYHLHRSAWIDLFWLHGVMDEMDPTDSNAFAAKAIALLFVSLPAVELYARWRLGEFASESGLLGVSESKRGD